MIESSSTGPKKTGKIFENFLCWDVWDTLIFYGISRKNNILQREKKIEN